MQTEGNEGVFGFDSDIVDESQLEPNQLDFNFDTDLNAESGEILAKEMPFLKNNSSIDLDEFDELNDDEDTPMLSDSTLSVEPGTSLVTTSNNRITVLDVENAIEKVTSNNYVTLKNLSSCISGELSKHQQDIEARLTAFLSEGDIPSFITEKDIAILITEFAQQDTDLTDDDFLNSIVNKFNIDSSILNNHAAIIELKMFLSKALRRINFNLSTTSQDLDDISNRTKSIMQALLNTQELQTSIDESSTTLITKALITPSTVSLECSCGGTVISTDNLITFVRASGELSFCCAKLVCAKCGKNYVLDDNGIKRLSNSVDDKVLNLQGLRGKRSYKYDTGVPNVLTYSPSFYELNSAFPGVFDFMIDKSETKKVIEVNLDEMKLLAREKNSLFFSKHSINIYNELGIKSIAKIVSGTCNSYSNLKERAISSLLQEFESTRLNLLSTTNRNITKIPLLYKDNYGGFERDLARCFITDSVNSKTDYLDKEKFDKDFTKYLSLIENTDNDAYLMVDQLYKYSKLFSSLAITNSPLNKDLVDKYLGDEQIFKCVDYLTDLMIISNLSEDFLTNFSPRRREGEIPGKQVDIKRLGSAKREASYSASIRDILDVNKMSDDRPLRHLLDYFSRQLTTNVMQKAPDLNVEELALFYSDDPEFYKLVYRFSKYLLDSDYYEASLIKHKLESDYKFSLNKMLGIVINNNGTVTVTEDNFIVRNDLKDLADLIKNTPTIDTNKFPDKFSYYFKNENGFSEEEKIEVMKLFTKLKIVPKKLKGETFADKIEYYKSLVNNPSETEVNEPFKTIVDNNYILLLSLVNLSKTQPTKFTLFMLARDLLILFRKISFNDICSCLYLNKDIVSFYLTDEFNCNVDPIDNSFYLKYLFFKSKELSSIIRDDNLTVVEKQSELESCMPLILNEFIKLPKVFEIIKDFVSNKIEDEEDLEL